MVKDWGGHREETRFESQWGQRMKGKKKVYLSKKYSNEGFPSLFFALDSPGCRTLHYFIGSLVWFTLQIFRVI